MATPSNVIVYFYFDTFNKWLLCDVYLKNNNFMQLSRYIVLKKEQI